MAKPRDNIFRLTKVCGLYAPSRSEDDPKFREIIDRQSRVGMHLAAFLAIFGPTFGVGASWLLAGGEYALFPRAGSLASGYTIIADEVLIVVLGLVALGLSRLHSSVKRGRFVVSLFLVIMFCGGVLEHCWIQNPNDVELMMPYTLFMLVGIGTMPLRARHAFWLGMALMTSAGLTAWLVTPLIGGNAYFFPTVGYVGMFMITLFCMGISALIYAGRWQQHVAQKQTESSEREYRSLFETSTDAMFVIENSTGLFVQVNPRFEELVGLPAAEIYQTPFPSLIDESDRDRVLEHHRARLAGEVAPSRYTLKVRAPSSTEVIYCDLTVHRSDDPRFTKGALRDITDHVKSDEKIRTYANELELANRELRDTQTQLVQSEKMAALGTLVAGVAHEINTPIGSIHANADVARRALDVIHAALEPTQRSEPPDLDKLHKAIGILSEANATTCTATDRIVRIVKSLRNFARLDEAEVKTVDIHEGIESTLTLVYHEYKNRIEIVREFGDLPKIACYPNQLNQVFVNILVNAIHAIQGKGTITIRTRRVGGYAEIAFSDTGGGIAKEHLSKIFDPGFTTKGVGVGTGLGLSIVYKIVDAHRGTIAVESEAGTGTTFTISLPVRGLDDDNKNREDRKAEPE